MDWPSSFTFLKGVAAFTTIWLAISAGAAIGMYIFTIPTIERGGSTKDMLRQFSYQISLGFNYMQTSSRTQTVLLAVMACFLYYHPDRGLTNAWQYYGFALLVHVQAAWYEIVFIFPTNEKLAAIESKLKKQGDTTAEEKARPEVLMLMEEWRRRHIVRMIIPLVTATIAISAFRL